MRLVDADWNAEWVRLKKERRWDDSAEYWDQRAPGFAVKARDSRYASEFLEHARILPGESVLDIGCGPGTLTLPLARDGHPVTSVDFSAGMLSLLKKRADEEGLQDVTTVRASWEDNWEAAGVSQADVAVASRSIAVTDLGMALRKLDSAARRRVCLTVSAGDSPRNDRRVFDAIGRDLLHDHDHIYCLNILLQMGIKPELRFIESAKPEFYETREDARQDAREMLGALTEHEEQLLDKYFDEHLVQAAGPDGVAGWRKDTPRIVSWAFISWSKGAACGESLQARA